MTAEDSWNERKMILIEEVDVLIVGSEGGTTVTVTDRNSARVEATVPVEQLPPKQKPRSLSPSDL